MRGHHEVHFIEVRLINPDSVLVLPSGYKPFAMWGSYLVCRKWISDEQPTKKKKA